MCLDITSKALVVTEWRQSQHLFCRSFLISSNSRQESCQVWKTFFDKCSGIRLADLQFVIKCPQAQFGTEKISAKVRDRHAIKMIQKQWEFIMEININNSIIHNEEK